MIFLFLQMIIRWYCKGCSVSQNLHNTLSLVAKDFLIQLTLIAQ